MLTHHFATKDDLVAAVLDHLDRRQRERLRAFHAKAGDRPLGEVIRASWRWHLDEDLPLVRLLHEIEGLAAAGRLRGPSVSRMLADRAAFVAGVLASHGVPAEVAERNATFLNAAYAGLQTDYLTTGDRERVEAALEQLIALAEAWTRPHPGPTPPPP